MYFKLQCFIDSKNIQTDVFWLINIYFKYKKNVHKGIFTSFHVGIQITLQLKRVTFSLSLIEWVRIKQRTNDACSATNKEK